MLQSPCTSGSVRFPTHDPAPSQHQLHARSAQTARSHSPTNISEAHKTSLCAQVLKHNGSCIAHVWALGPRGFCMSLPHAQSPHTSSQKAYLEVREALFLFARRLRPPICNLQRKLERPHKTSPQMVVSRPCGINMAFIQASRFFEVS